MSRLLAATANGYTVELENFLSKNRSGRWKRTYGVELLRTALLNGHCNIARMLMERGVSVNNPPEDELKLNSPLHWAVMLLQEPNIVQLLIAKGADVNAVNLYGYTPLHVVVLKENIVKLGPDLDISSLEEYIPSTHTHGLLLEYWSTMVSLLLEAGANINATDRSGMTPLCHVVDQNVPILAKILLKFGANPNVFTTTFLGRCSIPIHLASMKGFEVMVDLLLSSGAIAQVGCDNHNSEDCDSFHVACKFGHVDVVIKLLQHGLNINETTAEGQNALLFAMTQTYLNNDSLINIARVLLEHGIQIDATDEDNSNVLHAAVREKHSSVLKLITQHCLWRGMDVPSFVNSPNVYGVTPLFIAAKEGCVEAIDILLDNGANIESSCIGLTPLHIAIKNPLRCGSPVVIALLLRRGANANSLAPSGQTPAQILLSSSLWPCKLIGLVPLLESGADPNIVDENDYTMLGLAIKHMDSCCNVELVKKILEHNVDSSNLHNKASLRLALTKIDAADDIIRDTIEELLKYGLTFNEIDVQDSEILHLAVKRNCFGAVKCLLEQGARCDVRERSQLMTPLLIATTLEYEPIVLHLLVKGANIHFKDKQGYTALHHAAIWGHTGIVDKLLQRGADINLLTNSKLEKKAPLHLAALKGHSDVVTLLIKNGADFNLLSMWGQKRLKPLFERCLHNFEFSLFFGLGRNHLITGLTPLHFAVKKEHLKAVVALIRGGADVNAVTYIDNTTVLLMAAQSSNEEILETLLYHGADPLIRTGGQTPLCWGTEKGYDAIIRILLDYGGFTPDICCSAIERLMTEPDKHEMYYSHFLCLEAQGLWASNDICECREYLLEQVESCNHSSIEVEVRNLKLKVIVGRFTLFDMICKPVQQWSYLTDGQTSEGNPAATELCTGFPIFSKVLKYRWKLGTEHQQMKIAALTSLNTMILESIASHISAYPQAMLKEALRLSGYSWLLHYMNITCDQDGASQMSQNDFLQILNLRKNSSLLPPVVMDQIISFLPNWDLKNLAKT